MHILVVDDNPHNVSLPEILLRGHGYDVIAAYNGAEALEKAVQERFALIISDILMPQMDGFQLCRAVKTNQHLQDVPFVFYSAAYTDPQDQAFALSLGAEKFVAKPHDPRVLVAIVQDVIRQCAAGRPVMPPSPEVEETVYLQRMRADIPAILCTGLSQAMTAETARQLGINAFLMKPLSLRDLASTIRRVLEPQPTAAPDVRARLVVIDDEDQVRGMLRDVLTAAGHTVLEASNGAEGVRHCRATPVDLVITDLIMPEQEGLETIQILRREFPATEHGTTADVL